MAELKCVLLGSMGVGKSCLINRLVNGQFQENSLATLQAQNFKTKVNVKDTTVRLSLWDTAGQERFENIQALYYRGAQLAAIVFDVTNEESFAKAQFWMAELKQKSLCKTRMTLLANKADCAPEFDIDIAKQFAKDNDLLFYEVSAKTGQNVKEAFEGLAGAAGDPAELNHGKAGVIKVGKGGKKGCC